MNYIVIDMEWNQPANPKRIVRTPVYLHSEIIQIGAVKLDSSLHPLDTFKILIAPKYYRKMNKKVSALTGIRTEDLQYGFPFPVAFRHFRKWCGTDFTFLTWGPDDIPVLRSNLKIHRLNPAWIPKSYDLQRIFSIQFPQQNRQVSLSCAMEMLGESALDAHDALHDARNAAAICRHLDLEKGIAEYSIAPPKAPPARISLLKQDAAAKTYAVKDDALRDAELICFPCPTCGGTVTCGEIVRQNSSKFIAIAACENGEKLFVRFKFLRLDDGRLRVSRVLHELDEDAKTYYFTKKQHNADARAAYLQRSAAAG